MQEYDYCRVCDKLCNEDDFCYGCKEYICEECDFSSGSPMGDHSWEAHDKRFK
jgi:hypothetical protein